MPLKRTQNVVSVSNSYTAKLSDDVIICDCSGAGFQVTLPAAASVPGKTYSVLKVDATVNVLVIAAASGNINGSASKNTGTQFAGWTVTSDSANYFILA